jgi:hypothetical protein
VALLNAIQRSAKRIQSEHARRSHEYELYAHLESILDSDAPRRQYVRRFMERIVRRWEECVVLEI